MRLDEITNSNIVWGKLSGVDLTAIDEYTQIILLLKSLIALNSHYRVTAYLHTIDTFENALNRLLSIDYGGYPNQQDIKSFKNKCMKMQTNIRYLKSKLP